MEASKIIIWSTIIHGSHTHQSVPIRQVYSAWARADAGKGGQGMMGINWIFCTRQKRCVDDICTYGSFQNIYGGLKLCMVAIRTNLFATPSLHRVGTCW